MLEIISLRDCTRTKVTTLIHKYSAEFDPDATIFKMRSSRNWPRPEYVDPECNWGVIAKMLRGTLQAPGRCRAPDAVQHT